MQEIQQLEVAEALALSQLKLKRQNTVNTHVSSRHGCSKVSPQISKDSLELQMIK